MNGSTKKREGGQPVVEGTAGLASYLGVSRWTISRVLNGQPGVKEETRQRVLRAMEELGFEPNRMARGLKGARSRLIGVSFQHLEALILARKSNALQGELRERGYRGIYEMAGLDARMEEEVVRHFLSIQVDGIVLIGSVLEEDSLVFQQARERGVSLVMVDPRNELSASTVRLDRRQAMYETYEHLHALGHETIDLFGLASDDMYKETRMKGLLEAAKKLTGDKKGESLRHWSLDGFGLQEYGYGKALAEKVMRECNPLPTAILCLNDRLAIGAMRTFQEEGISIPEEISIVGFDNLPETSWTRPRLTTYDQNINDLMGKTTQVMMQSLQGKHIKRVKVNGKLIVRESTAMARKKL